MLGAHVGETTQVNKVILSAFESFAGPTRMECHEHTNESEERALQEHILC